MLWVSTVGAHGTFSNAKQHGNIEYVYTGKNVTGRESLSLSQVKLPVYVRTLVQHMPGVKYNLTR